MPGTQGQSPLPPPNPQADAGNNIAAQTGYGSPTTQAPTNPNPQRGGTTVRQGQAGVAGNQESGVRNQETGVRGQSSG
jgi:hypothetical protein